MRQSLAIAFACGLVGGCSLIYNPNDLDNPKAVDAMRDVPVDVETIMPANPNNIGATQLYPLMVDEGRGDHASQPALLVIKGHDFTTLADHLMATFTLMPGMSTGGGSGTLTIDSIDVGDDHNWIALGVRAPVDKNCAEGQHYVFGVAVSEDNGSGGTATAPLTDTLTIVCHAELDGALTSTAALSENTLFSEVAITGSATLAPSGGPAFIYSASTITVAGNITADASGQSAGPGGYPGGAATKAGGGGACGGGGNNDSSGGGGGFLTAGGVGVAGALGTAASAGQPTGDQTIMTFSDNFGCGGGGGAGLSSLGGGPGGGGGGTIALKAFGDITITGGLLSANGAAGSSSGQGAGGGAGGLVVVRTQGSLNGLSSVTVSGGAAGAGTGSGSHGRVRFDAATFPQMITTPDPNTGTYIGPMPMGVPLVSHEQTPMISVVGQGFGSAEGYVINQASNVMIMKFTVSFGNSTPSTVTVQAVPLTSGYNQVCTMVPGGDPQTEVATNCVEMAFLP
jgi:hypothetical protein